MKSPLILAAGVVLWRHGDDGVEIALVHRPRHDDWTIPKGKLKRGEHLLRAARREVREETGMLPLLGRRLSPSFYDKSGRPKRVDYWAGTVAPDRRITAPTGDDVDAVEWVTTDEASRILSYERDLLVLQDFLDGPMQTVPVILPASAAGEPNPSWTDDEHLRPLDAEGRSRARALGKLLSYFGRCVAVSAPNAETVETLLPYAIDQSVPVTTEPAFAAGTGRWAGLRLEELMRRGDPLIVCAAQELLPRLVTSACAQLGAAAPQTVKVEPGAFWVLHVAGDALAAVEHHTLAPGRERPKDRSGRTDG